MEAALRWRNSWFLECLAQIVLHLCAATHSEAMELDFYCRQGRHRSTAIVMWYGLMLRWLGARVVVCILSPADDRGRPRLCGCQVCNSNSWPLRAEIGRTTEMLTGPLFTLLQAASRAGVGQVSLACEVIEFLEYAR